MPLTFPSHAAAVWPLHRLAPRVLPAAALVVGSCTPDLGYLVDVDGLFTHSLAGTVIFSLPIGLIALAWLELVSPTLRRVLAPRLGELFQREPFPRSVRAALQTLLALWLGALTHLAWDGFTHRTRWPASVLYPTTVITLPLTNATMQLANVFQHLSTVLGALLVIAWVRSLPSPEAARPSSATGQRDRIALLIAMGFGMIAVTLLHPNTLWQPWALFWHCAQGALAAGTLTCVVLQRRARLSSLQRRRGTS